MNLIKDLGYDENSDEVRTAREMAERDERIKIRSYYSPKSKLYYAYVRVNDEQYASASGPDKESVLAEANHYASQIEFDERGNW